MSGCAECTPEGDGFCVDNCHPVLVDVPDDAEPHSPVTARPTPVTADGSLRADLAAALLSALADYGAGKTAPEVDLFDFYADALTPVVERLQRQAAAKARAEHHCGTCECIHEPCGYVIGTAGCNDYHDRADGIEAT